jgi:hypothetical protein
MRALFLRIFFEHTCFFETVLIIRTMNKTLCGHCASSCPPDYIQLDNVIWNTDIFHFQILNFTLTPRIEDYLTYWVQRCNQQFKSVVHKPMLLHFSHDYFLSVITNRKQKRINIQLTFSHTVHLTSGILNNIKNSITLPMYFLSRSFRLKKFKFM